MSVTKANNPTQEAKAIREEFNEYFSTREVPHGSGVVHGSMSESK